MFTNKIFNIIVKRNKEVLKEKNKTNDRIINKRVANLEKLKDFDSLKKENKLKHEERIKRIKNIQRQ